MGHRLLVVGVGNRDRGDDAVGPIVCDLLREGAPEGVDVQVVEGTVVDLPLLWDTDDRVVIVDAAAPAGEPGRITDVDALDQRLLLPRSISTHSIDVGAAIELARAIGRLPAELTVIGIEGAAFEHGAPLSAEVQRAAGRAVTRISRRAVDGAR